ISIETVKTHRKNILIKLGNQNVCELTNFDVFF
nr:DNA-binding response regulator [Pseudopedobacter sp.]